MVITSVGYVRSAVVSAALTSVIVLVSYVCLLAQLNQLIATNYCSLNIFIAILSQRSNFIKRQTLRQTWIKTVEQINRNEYNSCQVRLTVRFIVGDRDCPISPMFRSDPYSCVLSQIQTNDNNSETYLHKFNSIRGRFTPYKTTYRGFSFVIRHPIIVTRLALHKNFVNGNSVSIVLLDAQTKEELARVSISTKSSSHKQVYFEAIEKLVLLKDFYGILMVEDQILKSKIHFWPEVSLNQNGFVGILRAYYGFTDYESIGYEAELIVGPTLAYEASKPDDIETLKLLNNSSQTKWITELKQIDQRLNEEMDANKDIMIINSIDVYRNLPEKVLQSTQLAIGTSHLSHFIKTDDDCYLNVINIVNELMENKDLKRVWFGNFRRLWPTDKWSKWAENEYQSAFYPAFACGSGYVLSLELIEWLATNIDHLHRYQGEDVSMGIWMAAINPYLKDDKRWLCAEGMDIQMNDTFSFANLDDKQMYKIHNYLIKP